MSSLKSKPQYEITKHYNKLKSGLNQAGYIQVTKVTDTLQGVVLKAVQKSTNQPVVIKMANKYLHKMQMAYIDGKKYRNIMENILDEARILRYLTEQKHAPQSIIKYTDFLECVNNYYLVMTDGGGSLFEFVKQVHSLISDGHIDVSKWHSTVKVIFKQMLRCVEYIHSQFICHFDISLENFLINDVEISCERHKNMKHSKIAFNLDDIDIKLIDFGLAMSFKATDNYLSNKFCGKMQYKSPEIVSGKQFSAQKNDTWCLGVCLFMMAFGCGPWDQAVESDALFNIMMNGGMVDVLKSWGLKSYGVDQDLIDLLQSVFKYEEQRASLEQLKKHSWLK